MPEGKFSRVFVAYYNGMDQGTAATKLKDGLFVIDRNGRRNQTGSWGQRLGVVRVGGGVTQATGGVGSLIRSIHQFLPLGSGSQNYAAQAEYGAVRLSNLIFVAGGVAEGFQNPVPQQ
jgi:hypothetical protein